MIRWALALLLSLAILLVVSCGGSGSGSDATNIDQPSAEALRGVWTATLDDRAQRQVVAELTITNGTITGFLKLFENGTTYSGPVTGTYNPPHIEFTAQLEGHDPFTFETDRPLVPGRELEGTFRFRLNDKGKLILRREDDRSAQVTGDWSGEFQSSEFDRLGGSWKLALKQEGHRVQGRGTLSQGEQEFSVNLSGSVVGRHLDLALAIGENASLWRAEVVRDKDKDSLGLRGKYLGRMTPGDGIDAGIVTGHQGSGGGHEGITIRPVELQLPPGATETLHVSRNDVEWSQRSEAAQPGEFIDKTPNSVRFRAPFIGGAIQVRATAKENPDLFGLCRVMVTGATGQIAGERFHTLQGGAVKTSRNERPCWSVKIPTREGIIHIRTPFVEEPTRFALALETAVIGFETKEIAFVADGREGTSGVIRITRVGNGRMSGEFEAVMKHREHAERTLEISGHFDVPTHRTAEE